MRGITRQRRERERVGEVSHPKAGESPAFNDFRAENGKNQSKTNAPLNQRMVEWGTHRISKSYLLKDWMAAASSSLISKTV